MTLPFNIGDDDCFFFESDHLALRGNKDYCEILKTLVILTAQREQLLKDYNKVVEIKKNVLEDTENVLNKLRNGENLGIELPNIIELPKLPVVNFNAYNVKVPESKLNLIYSQASCDDKIEELKKEQIATKPELYNPWSTEEQKKLEELLMKYPPEPVDRRRYQKIANDLGTRSVAQVASRIQKYFLKLYKAGLPIPGRIPKSTEKYKKSFLHKHQRFNHYLWKPTTFFPKFNPPVTMDELDNIPGPSINMNSSDDATSSNYLIESGYHAHQEITGKTNAELQVQLLKKVKEEKIREQENENSFRHIGYKCDYCETEPITGTRWSCTVCSNSIDFCTDCVVSQMYSSNCHPLTHPLALFQTNENSGISHGGEAMYVETETFKENPQSDSEDTSDSYAFNEFDIKEELEEGIGSDEESRSNFDDIN